MAAQERYATEAHLIAGGASQEVVTAALEKQDALITLVHEGAEFEMVQALAGDDGPRDSAELELVRRWLDHDPRPALERIVCSLLAIFGENDLLVPVAESARIFRATYAGPPGNLDIVTIPGADHRLQVDNPPVLHPSYLPTLCGWIVERLAHRVPIAPATSESRARE
jgi:pimeloyl-ACP methyl ester carboxylesterase